MTAPAEWLAAKASSYGTDARRLARVSGEVTEGLTGEQWAIIYRAVAAELLKCAKEMPS